TNIVNELLKRGVTVINDGVAEVHVSGHACVEELKIIHALTRPQCFIPVHGEYKHLKRHADLARELGMPDKNILIPQTGRVIELGKKTLTVGGEVTAGAIMVDGYSVGDVGVAVLRDRRHLAEDGILIMVAAIDSYMKAIITGPDISTKGFVYAKESEGLLDELRKLAQKSIERCFAKGLTDTEAIKMRVKDELNSVIYQRTK
ncbi:MAG: ribonuclease J, partial [Clostridia bacterium]